MGWLDLPPWFQSSLDRRDYLYELSLRQKEWLFHVESVLTNIGVQGDYKVIESGDWHSGSCVLVLKESKEKNSRLFVIKPRCNEATLLLKSIIDQQELSEGFGISIPFSRKENGIWLQDYVQANEERTLLSVHIGGLVATTLWAGLTDLHDENLIFNDLGVHFVDTECAFDFSAEWSALNCLSACGLVTGKCPGLAKVKVRDYSRTSINRAIQSASKILIAGTPTELYENMDSVSLRRVLIATRIYMTFLRQRFLFGWTDSELEARWRHLRSANPAPDSIVSSELLELKSWNVPFFYQRGEILLDDRGVVHNRCELPSVTMQGVHKMLSDSAAIESITHELCAALELSANDTRSTQLLLN